MGRASIPRNPLGLAGAAAHLGRPSVDDAAIAVLQSFV